jgi:cytochrome c peroxidase
MTTDGDTVRRLSSATAPARAPAPTPALAYRPAATPHSGGTLRSTIRRLACGVVPDARTVIVLQVLLAGLLLQAQAAPAVDGRLTAVERARVLSHGPWPPPAATDAGNAWAGRPAVVVLGQQLFFERRLAPDGHQGCASCHVPALAFGDRRARGVGRVELDRNTPSLWNAVHERWWGWDGAADSLWSQALRPLQDPREIASNGPHLRGLFTTDPTLACRWRAAFSAPLPDDDERLLVLTAKAVGAFVATLVSGPTPFDRFRDALVGQAADAAAAQTGYPAEALRGLRLFVGRGRCHLCHVGPRFSNGEFADIGAGFFRRPGQVDPGRHGGIVALRQSPYTLMGPHADAPGDAAIKTRHVALQHRNFGEFKVPSLRNVALTAPYLHDGRIDTLAGMVRHYSELDIERLHADGERILQPLHLSTREQQDLLAFLESLSDAAATRWQAPALSPCRNSHNRE